MSWYIFLWIRRNLASNRTDLWLNSVFYTYKVLQKQKKSPWLITWLRVHIFTCRRKSSFMRVMIYLPFPFVRRKKNQRLQGLLYYVMLNFMWLFIESFPGTTEQQGLYAYMNIFALPSNLDENPFRICYLVTLPRDAEQCVKNKIKQASISRRNWWHDTISWSPN